MQKRICVPRENLRAILFILVIVLAVTIFAIYFDGYYFVNPAFFNNLVSNHIDGANTSKALKGFLKDQSVTMRRVHEYCAATNLSRQLHPYLYSYDANTGFLFCRNHKVSSTTMLEIFRVHLSGIPSEITALEISDPVYPESLHYSWAAEHFKPQSPEQIRNLSRSALLYSIVRLVSAYENKILRPDIRLGAWFLATHGQPSFAKFVEVILEGAKTCGEGVCAAMDEHWKPYYAGCSYCDLQYDFITKIENLERDLHVVFNIILGVKIDEVFHFNGRGGGGNEKIQAKTLNYLEQLSPESREALYQAYRHDFEMFGYDA